MSKVLVTGGAGFLGSHLIEKLIKERHHVMIVDNFTSGKVDNIHVMASLACCDIRDAKLQHVFETFKPDVVFHMASRTKYNEKLKSLKNDLHYEVGDDLSGTINVLDCCVKLGVRKVVFPSSIEVYGDAEGKRVSEFHTLNPRSYYGHTKLKQERYFEVFHENYDLNYTILRLSNVYGKRQEFSGESRVFTYLQDCIENELPLSWKPNSHQVRDCIYIDDAVGALISAMDDDVSTVYNIGLGIPISTNEIIGCLEGLLKRRAVFQMELGYETGNRTVYYDITKAIEGLDWSPYYSLSLGLTDLIRHRDEVFEMVAT